MTKTIEVPDIAQWEETDSELAKYTIGKLNRELDVSIKVAKSLAQDLEKAETKIDKLVESILKIDTKNETLELRIDKAIERLQDYDLVEDKQKVIDDVFDILRGEEDENNK